MEQTVTVADLDALADALHALADLIARGRATVLADHWSISAYDFMHKAQDIADAMHGQSSHLWTGEIGTLAGRQCCTVEGTLAGHRVRMTYTLDDLDWHGPKVGESA